MRRIVLALCACLIIAYCMLLILMAYEAAKNYQPNKPFIPPPSISHQEYSVLGQLMMTDPVFRMGSMIDMQCNVAADFNITPKEKRRLAKLYSKLKKRPERMEEPRMQLCDEWKNIR